MECPTCGRPMELHEDYEGWVHVIPDFDHEIVKGENFTCAVCGWPLGYGEPLVHGSVNCGSTYVDPFS